MQTMILPNPKKIYLIGIKGTGLSSLAVVLKKMGHQVTGSDTAEKFFTESQLRSNHIKFFEGFNENNLIKSRPELAIYSTAYNEHHPEVAKAKHLGLPLFSYPEAVGWLAAKFSSVAVSGSHGKTTTTAMLGVIMQRSQPALTLVGTVANQLKNKVKNPKYFIFEADEYQDKLRYYNPQHFILTNIDFDHPDYFKNARHYRQIFQDFCVRILNRGGTILYGYDSPPARTIFKKLGGKISSFGFSSQADYQIKNVDPAVHQFSICHHNQELFPVTLAVYGKHNILNAAAAAIMARQLGVPVAVVQRELKSFTWVKRRMELIPSKKYIIIDDYGHHPTEVRATLAALRHHHPQHHMVAVFHPHTFTRTKTFLKDFGRSFRDADLAIILDIYGSAREVQGTVHARDVVAEIKKNGTKAIHCPTTKEAAEYINKHVAPHSVVLTIGAGDVWKLCDMIK